MGDPVVLLFATISQFLSIYSLLLVGRILLSWFPSINWFDPPFSILSQLTDPYLNIFRSVIPPLGGMDFSPILALLLLNLVQSSVLPAVATMIRATSIGMGLGA